MVLSKLDEYLSPSAVVMVQPKRVRISKMKGGLCGRPSVIPSYQAATRATSSYAANESYSVCTWSDFFTRVNDQSSGIRQLTVTVRLAGTSK